MASSVIQKSLKAEVNALDAIKLQKLTRTITSGGSGNLPLGLSVDYTLTTVIASGYIVIPFRTTSGWFGKLLDLNLSPVANTAVELTITYAIL